MAFVNRFNDPKTANPRVGNDAQPQDMGSESRGLIHDRGETLLVGHMVEELHLHLVSSPFQSGVEVSNAQGVVPIVGVQ